MHLNARAIPAIATFLLIALLVAPAAEAFRHGGGKGTLGGGRVGEGGVGGPRKGDGRMDRGPERQQQREAAPADALDPELIGAFVPQRATATAMRKRGFMATGLVPDYREAVDCPPIASPFAAPTRSDGSARVPRFFHGLHGGIDIPQPKGTPLLAMADGEVIVRHEGEAGGIGGLGLWLRHAPEDTGTGKYVFVEYKHLDRLPDLEVGARVKMGQQIGETGNTGTVGLHYGREGFYHLHMTAYWSDSADFSFNRVLIPADGHWLDPLALLRGGPLDSHAAQALPEEQKRVPIPYRSADGSVFPAGTRLVWPYACTPK